MWEARASRFPEHTPNTREYYLLRSIFEEQFPSQQAMATVPKVCAPAAGVLLIQIANCSSRKPMQTVTSIGLMSACQYLNAGS